MVKSKTKIKKELKYGALFVVIVAAIVGVFVLLIKYSNPDDSKVEPPQPEENVVVVEETEEETVPQQAVKLDCPNGDCISTQKSCCLWPGMKGCDKVNRCRTCCPVGQYGSNQPLYDFEYTARTDDHWGSTSPTIRTPDVVQLDPFTPVVGAPSLFSGF